MSGPVANNIFKASGVVAAAAGGLSWQPVVIPPTTGRTFTVTVANVGGANYYFIGGVQQLTLNLLEGFTYKFDQADSSNSNHPFRFSTTSNGTHGGGSEYTTGVTTSGTPGNAGAYTQIAVAANAPTLYYYCTNHSNMGGTANTISVNIVVSSGKGYWIDTTSDTGTILLPSSPSKGDQIILVDYARTWGTNEIIIDSNGSNYQGQNDTYTVKYSTNGEVLNIVYSDGTKGWIPQDDDEVADAPVAPPTQKGIFGFGYISSSTGVTNLVGSNGVVAADTAAVGTAKRDLSATTYGGDKAIFAFGNTGSMSNTRNLVNNSGVVQSNASGAGTARQRKSAVSYGLLGEAIFAYGENGGKTNGRNLVNSSGVIASDVSGAGTARTNPTAVNYGSTGQAIFAYGQNAAASYVNISNLVSNTGVLASDGSGVGTASQQKAATTFGSSGQALIAFGVNSGGSQINTRNIVGNNGVVAGDVSGAGTARYDLAATNYGGDKGIFAFGTGSSITNLSNLVNSSGVVASDTTGVGTSRYSLAAAGFSYSA